MKRAMKIGSVLILLSFVIALGVRWLLREDCLIARLKESRGGTINIYAQNAWEVTWPFSYEVSDRGKIILRKWSFLYVAEGQDAPKFLLVSSNKGRLVAVVTQEYPDALLICHDFATNESWPHRGHIQGQRTMAEVGQTLLRRFTEEFPNKGYWLNAEQGYPPEKK